jgi:hypothetical protein
MSITVSSSPTPPRQTAHARGWLPVVADDCVRCGAPGPALLMTRVSGAGERQQFACATAR